MALEGKLLEIGIASAADVGNARSFLPFVAGMQHP